MNCYTIYRFTSKIYCFVELYTFNLITKTGTVYLMFKYITNYCLISKNNQLILLKHYLPKAKSLLPIFTLLERKHYTCNYSKLVENNAKS